MLKSIELVNFESHEHTVIKDLPDTLAMIVGASNVGKCLTGDTVIVDKDGSMRTIYDMFRQGEWYVPSIADWKFEWRRAVAIKANGNKRVFHLRTRKGFEIDATSNHRFLTIGGWKELSMLQPGTWIAVARNIPIFGNKKLPYGHARLLGYLLGDGHVGSGGIGFTNADRDVLNDYRNLVQSVCPHFLSERKAGKAITITASKPRDTINRHIGACGIQKLCCDYGIRGMVARNKKIPDAIFSATREDIVDVLAGLFMTDGWVCRRLGGGWVVGYCSTSMVMAKQVHHLLLRLGVVSSIRTKNGIFKYKGRQSKIISYTVDIEGSELVLAFARNFLGVMVGKKKARLAQAEKWYLGDRRRCKTDVFPKSDDMLFRLNKAINRSRLSNADICKRMGVSISTDIRGQNRGNKSMSFPMMRAIASIVNDDVFSRMANTDLHWDRVKEITDAGIKPTFDIEVDGTHTFFANDIYTHNSSIVRALKLAAFNEFDPQSIRVGKNKCTVIVETERGTVKVTRGPKVNTWEVTKVGQPTQFFDKVGKNVVPEAAAIIGLNIVRLGDADIPVNIMNQLESHFMLASMGGQDATGSLRAQVVDEISGLSGIEGVIKDVSLDIHRFGREVKVTEDGMETIRARLHDQGELEREQEILAQAATYVAECEKLASSLEAADKHIETWNTVVGAVNEAEAELAALPDTDSAKALLIRAEAGLSKYTKAEALHGKYSVLRDEVDAVEQKLAEMPDTDKAKKFLTVADGSLVQYKAARDLHAKAQKAKAELSTLEKRAAQMAKAGDPAVPLAAAAAALEKCKAAAALYSDFTRRKKEVEQAEAAIKKCDTDIARTKGKIEELLKKIQVCPLTLGPVSQECLEKAKTA